MNNYFKINELANQCRREWKINEHDPIDIFSIAINKIKNLTIVFLIMEDDISGASYKSRNENLIFINSKHSKGRQSFTLAHEIYHLKYAYDDLNICGINSNEEIEKTADQFASCLIMPHGGLESYKLNKNIDKWTLDTIIEAEQFFQISHQAILWRIRKLNEISYKQYMEFKKDIKLNSLKKGFDLSLYEPFSNKDYYTIGNYIRLAEKAFKHDLISIGKKEELLLEAFCGDLVYNLNKEESFE